MTYVGRALVAFGALLLLCVASVLFQAFRLEREARDETVSWSGSACFSSNREIRRDASTTGRIGHMVISRLGLRAPVLEGIGARSLLLGVGHVPETALPGEADNAALAGHRDTHFAKLRRVEKGDSIRIATEEGTFSYVVDSAFVVSPNRGDLLRPTGKPTLTLVTCYPFAWIGPAPKRFVVRASGVSVARGT